MLNNLKVMGVLPLFIPLWGFTSKKLPWKFPCAHRLGKFLKRFLDYNWIMSWLKLQYDNMSEIKINYESTKSALEELESELKVN